MARQLRIAGTILVVLAIWPAHGWGWPFGMNLLKASIVEKGFEKAATSTVAHMADSGVRFAYQQGVTLGNDAREAMRNLKLASKQSGGNQDQNDWTSWILASKATLPKQHDMVIDLENLQDITDNQRGWPINIRDETVLEKVLDKSTLKVAVLGMYNRGKTYITSWLAGEELEHGQLVHTVGLSVVLNKANNIAFMDTAGENRAVIVNSKTEEEAELEIKRRVLGVQFLQEVVLEIADLVIVVVNQLTLEDQRYVAKIAKKLKLFKQEKQMIVIHNFKDTKTEKDLQELEAKDIQLAMGAVRQAGSHWWKTERFNALHVSMGSTYSAKDKNTETLRWVRDTLEHRIPMLGADILRKSFMNRFVEVSRKWLPIFFDGFTQHDLNEKFELVALQSQPKYIFHVGPNCSAKLQKDLVVAEWEILNHYKVYELPYEVFQWKNETRVHVEIPGVFREDPLGTENVTFKKHQPDPFGAKFAWTEDGEQVLNVTVRMAPNKHSPPGMVIDAYRHQIAGEMPEPIRARGTSVNNRGKAQLKIDFDDIHGPQQFIEPSAIVHRNGIMIVTLKHAGMSPEDEL